MPAYILLIQSNAEYDGEALARVRLSKPPSVHYAQCRLPANNTTIDLTWIMLAASKISGSRLRRLL